MAKWTRRGGSSRHGASIEGALARRTACEIISTWLSFSFSVLTSFSLPARFFFLFPPALSHAELGVPHNMFRVGLNWQCHGHVVSSATCTATTEGWQASSLVERAARRGTPHASPRWLSRQGDGGVASRRRRSAGVGGTRRARGRQGRAPRAQRGAQPRRHMPVCVCTCCLQYKRRCAGSDCAKPRPPASGEGVAQLLRARAAAPQQSSREKQRRW